VSSRIYTKTGDRGETGLIGGKRVPKDELHIEACGAVDELNAVIGVAAAQCADQDVSRLLVSIQEDLFQLGADVAVPHEEPAPNISKTAPRIQVSHAERLEKEIDRWEMELEPLRNFILPGGHPVAAILHQARAVCRRAERRCVTLRRSAQVSQDQIIIYLNRLSDLLFVLSRAVNRRNLVADVLWKP